MRLYLLSSLLLFTFQNAWGQAQPTTKIHYVQEMYTGEDLRTFDREKFGSGVELILSTKKSILNYFTKGKFVFVSGSQDFLDNGTEVDSSFTYYKSSFEVGANVYPISRKSKQANLYIGVSGLVSYNYMSLESDSFTEVKSSYQAMSFGYSGLMGVEWQILGRYALTAEFSQRFESANLVEVSNFGLNAFTISVGLGW